MSLNIADIQKLQPRFEELRAQIKQPDYVRNGYVRINGELLHVFELKVTWLNPKFGEAVAKIKRPIGWRRKIMQRSKKKSIKDLDIKNLISPNPYRYLGRLIGLFDNSIQGLSDMNFLPDEETYWDEVFKPFLDIDDETKQKIEAHWDKIANERQIVEDWAVGLDNAKQKDFRLGQAEKLNAVFAKNGSLSHNPKTNDVYGFLLMGGELVRGLGSIEEIYEFMIKCFPPDFEYEFEAFQRLCTYVEYRGARYSASMKRVKSVDRHKARVLTQ